MRPRRLVKAAALALLVHGGFLQLWRRRRRGDVTILMLHGVMDCGVPHDWVPLRERIERIWLDRTVGLLSRHYQFVSLSEAVRMVTRKAPAKRYPLTLTFDDGYRNNLKHALPILDKHGAPATVFLCSAHVQERKPFWFDRLDYALQQVELKGREFEIAGARIRFSGSDRAGLTEGYARLREAAKRRSVDDFTMNGELDRLANSLERESGRRLEDGFEEDEWSAVLGWDEIRGAQAQGVAFGSHTVDHVRLACVNTDAARDQLVQSREAIERETGTACTLLCYPDGSYNDHVAALAAECGYQGATTTSPGLNRIGANPMTLRRFSFPMHGTSAEILARLAGFPMRTVWPRRGPRW